MQAVILAGGLGTRLRPLTYKIPKPMVPINGRPYLEYQINFLRKSNITNIVVLIGYLGEQIVEYFKDGANFGVSLKYIREESPCGTGGALLHAYDALEEPFLLIYGDSFLPIDYQKFVHYFKQTSVLGVIVAYDNSQNTGVKNNLALDENNMVTKYEKNTSATDLAYVESGVAILRKKVLLSIPKDFKIPVSLEIEIFPHLITKRQLAAFKTSQAFYDIGTPLGLKRAANYFLHNQLV